MLELDLGVGIRLLLLGYCCGEGLVDLLDVLFFVYYGEKLFGLLVPVLEDEILRGFVGVPVFKIVEHQQRGEYRE